MEKLTPPQKQPRNHSLDLLKFISSFFIVSIHFKFPGAAGELMTVLARFAVPVFFMISGYYSYHDDQQKIKKKIFNIVKIYFFAFLVYFCFNVLVKVYNGQYKEVVWYISTYLRIQYTSKTLLFNESITAMHLWFLGSLIYAYIIRYVALKVKIKDSFLYILSGILLVTGLILSFCFTVLGDMVPFLLKNYILRNFLFMGFPLFTLGHFIKSREDAVLRLASAKFLVPIIALSALDIIIAFKTVWTRDLYIGSVLLAFCLFVFALKGKDKRYQPWLLSMIATSANVYLVHVMIGDILEMTALTRVRFYAYAKPVIIFGLTVFVSWFVQCFIHRVTKGKRGKYFISKDSIES